MIRSAFFGRHAFYLILCGWVLSSLGLSAQGQDSVKKDFLAPVLKVVKRYRDLPLVRMSVSKRLDYEFRPGEPVTSSGKVYFSKGRMRLKIEPPNESLLILNGQTIWFERRIPEMDDKIQVAKFSTSQTKKTNALLAFLFDDVEVWKDFRLKRSKIEGDNKTFFLAPKDGSDLGQIKELWVTVDTTKDHLLQLGFKDALGNKTSYAFKKHQYAKKAPEELFSYTPPEGADVTIN